MKKTILLFTVLTSTVLFSTSVFAAAWNVPTNVRIVQKSNTDTTGRIYSTVQAALASIPTTGTNAPSATNPYVVKVMPGVYDLGTASLQMKDYVDIEGSGPDSTVITSSNNNVDGGTCTVGTVLMANNSSIRHIQVINRAPDLNGAYTSIAALVFNNVTANAEGISVLTGSDTAAGGQNNGVCTYGTSAHAILNNVTVKTQNLNGQSNPIQHMGGKVTLTNSKLAGFSTYGSVDIINNNNSASNPGTVTVMNSVLEGTCLTCGLQGITADGGAFTTYISNSKITLNGNNMAIAAQYDFFLENTKIVSNGSTSYSVDPAKMKIVNSQLPGDRAGLNGARLTNNYDEDYSPIPNQ